MFRCILKMVVLAGLSSCFLAQATSAFSQDDKEAKKTPLVDKKPSAADEIIRLQGTLKEDKKSLLQRTAEQESALADVKTFSKSLTQIKQDVETKKGEEKKLRDAGKTKEADLVQAQWKGEAEKAKILEQLLQLSLRNSKTLKAQIDTLDEKIKKTEQRIEELTGTAPPKKEPPRKDPPKKEPPEKKTTLPTLPGVPTPKGPDKAPPPKEVEDEPPSEEIQKAREEAKAKLKEARRAAEATKSIASRIKVLQADIRYEQTLLETDQGKEKTAAAAIKRLEGKIADAAKNKTPPAELAKLRESLKRATSYLDDTRQAIQQHKRRLTELQADMTRLQQEQILALQEEEKKKAEADAASGELAFLEHPLNPQNLLRWFFFSGPRLLLILLGMLLLLRLNRVMERRLSKLMADRSKRSSASQEERENRAQTLVSVLRYSLTVVIVVGGVIAILDEIGIQITVLMGGVAVFGLAIAFGAQNLIRDYFSGFMILMEDQYTVGDWVKVGEFSGAVERITLRVTVLRDLDGTVHFIPNGQVTAVSNMTHYWARALMEIRIPLHEDPARMMDLFAGIGKQMREEPEYQSIILEDPQMLGVDQVDDRGTLIKFYIKTRPMKQWGVRREMLRRIKERFDNLNIAIPYPQQVMHVAHGIVSTNGNGHNGHDAGEREPSEHVG